MKEQYFGILFSCFCRSADENLMNEESASWKVGSVTCCSKDSNFSPVTMLGPGMVKDESCWGEHAKCPRKGGDRRNNCHQSGSSGAAAGRTLSPESLDQLHLLLLDFATCFYSLLVDKVYY